MSNPHLLRVRDASITIVDADPKENSASAVYEFAVFGVSVLIHRREQWNTATNVPYVHIEDQNDGPGLLLVKVNNTGEQEHHRPHAQKNATT